MCSVSQPKCLFGRNITRIGHEQTRKLLLRDDDPARPAPKETFRDRRGLEIAGERIELAWHGANHSPDNIFIHPPDHDALMLVDIVNPGWAPVCEGSLTEDMPGYIEAPDTALTYPWKHFIGGHMGRLGTRDDVATHRQYIADIADSSRQALDTVDPTQYFGTATTPVPRYRAIWTQLRPPPRRRSSRSTSAFWRPPTSARPAQRSRLCNRSASTSATGRRSTHEPGDERQCGRRASGAADLNRRRRRPGPARSG